MHVMYSKVKVFRKTIWFFVLYIRALFFVSAGFVSVGTLPGENSSLIVVTRKDK
jgi:hypothetical protein